LFRDAHQQVRALAAFCAHRGADLALGRCVGGRIQCAYHGWEFDGTGRCVRIPAHPRRPIPLFARVAAYPVQERAGLVWVYPQPGDSVHVPPLELWPEVEDPAYVLVPYAAQWRAHLTRVVESVLDVAHIAFVHRRTIGRRAAPTVDPVSFVVPDRDTIRVHNGGGQLVYRFPQEWLLKPATGSPPAFINWVTFTPINRESTAIYGYAGRTFLRARVWNPWFRRYSLRVLHEDQHLVESQHPRPIPEALRMEAHVPADGPQVRFRQRWFQLLTHEEPKIVATDP